VWFQQVPEPKVAKNRWHFDLKVGGGRDVPLDVRARRVGSTVERLVAAGATVLRINDEPDAGLYAVALRDPEGNEFDVV
jgi:predicted enzyme related to lactoylglutathione lyase